MDEIQESLFDAGWSLFFSGSTYAMIKSDAVEGWVRLGSKGIADQLEAVRQGNFDFDSLSHLVHAAGDVDDGEDDGA